MNKDIFIGTIGIIATIAATFMYFNKPVPIDLAAKHEKSEAFLTRYPNSALLWGKIDEDMIAKVESLPENIDNLVLHSHGGESQSALKIAKIISERGYSVDVPSVCLSACSNLLLPAASSITFSNYPYIGYHGNALAKAHYVEEFPGNDKEYCYLAHSLEMKIFYLKNKIPMEFWRKEMRKLDVQDIELELIEKNNCVRPKITSKHEMWYPNSAQLKKTFGLKFMGNVCADDPDCYEKRLSESYNAPDLDPVSVVVGNKVF